MATPKNLIDFAAFGLSVSDPSSIDEETSRKLGNAVASSLKEIGFIYLKNHGIPKEKVS